MGRGASIADMEPTAPEPSPSAAPVEMPEDQGTAGWARKLQEGPQYWRRFLAQLLLATLMFGLSALVEAVVPLLRVLGHRRGVQAGPALGSFIAFLGGFVWLARVDADSNEAEGGLIAAVRDHSIEIAAVSLPALGAVLPGTVIARDRSPLLAWALIPVPRIAGSVVLAWSIDRAKRRAEIQPHGLE